MQAFHMFGYWYGMSSTLCLTLPVIHARIIILEIGKLFRVMGKKTEKLKFVNWCWAAAAATAAVVVLTHISIFQIQVLQGARLADNLSLSYNSINLHSQLTQIAHILKGKKAIPVNIQSPHITYLHIRPLMHFSGLRLESAIRHKV